MAYKPSEEGSPDYKARGKKSISVKSSDAGKASLKKATEKPKKKKKGLAERAGRAALSSKGSDKRPLNTAGKIGRAGKNVAKMLIGGFPG